MGLLAVCSAALLGVALADLDLLPRISVVLVGMGAVAIALQWRLLGSALLGFSLGAVRTWLPPLALPLAASGELAPLRATAQTAIAANLPEPQASLAAGVLLGGSGHLSPDFKLDLQRSGLAHLVAIDGFKEVVAASAVLWLLGRVLGRRLALLASIAAIAAYTLLVGAHPSAIRAALMAAMANIAALSGRVPDPLTSVLLATLAMALVDPSVLLAISLQLSVSAILGLVLLWPRLRRLRMFAALPRWIGEPVGLSLAVTLATLPVTLSTFQVVSLISPVTHIVAVPLLPVVLLTALVLACCSSLPAIGVVAAWLAWLPSTLLARVIEVGGSLPGAAISTGRPPVPLALAVALALLVYGVWQLPELSRARNAFGRWHRRHHELGGPALCAGMCLATAATLGAMRPDGQLHLEPLALSRGEAVFVRVPSGQTAVVVRGAADGPSLTREVSARLGVWEHQIDSVVVVDDAARRAVAPLLARYPAGQLAETSSAQLEVGDGELVEIASGAGQLQVIRSAPTTSAARRGSAS